MKKNILIIMIIMILPIILFITLDLINITNYISFTDRYDWLAFIGAYISGICTLILGFISIKQNGTLSDLNKQMLKNNMITTRFSQIDIEKENFFDQKILKDYMNAYGLKMKIDKENDANELLYTRLILQIKDAYDLPLISGKINKLEVYYNYERPYENEDNKTFKLIDKEIKLEVTPHDDKITYYLPICLIASESELKELNDSKKIRIVATIEIKNAFGVISKADFTIHLMKNETAGNWIRYSNTGRKVYYKEIYFEGENDK